MDTTMRVKFLLIYTRESLITQFVKNRRITEYMLINNFFFFGKRNNPDLLILKIILFLFLINPLNPELNPICHLLALLGAHHFLHVSRIRVISLTLRRLMSYVYGAPILEVSRSHTTTQHSR